MPTITYSDVVESTKPKGTNSWIFLIPNSIGEVVIVCSLIKEFKKKHGHKVTIITKELHSPIVDYYIDVIDYKSTLPEHIIYGLFRSNTLSRYDFKINTPIMTSPAHYRDGEILDLMNLYFDNPLRGGLNVVDAYRLMLKTGFSAPLHKISIPPKYREHGNALAERLGAQYKNSVVLFPGNSTTIPAPSMLWDSLISLYNEKGKTVFVNTNGSAFKQNISNPVYQEVNLDLKSAPSFCDYCGEVVTGNNGISYFLTNILDLNIKHNVIITDMQCFDYANAVFTKLKNYLSRSIVFTIPDTLTPSMQYREWGVPYQSSPDYLGAIASDIASHTPKLNLDRDTLFQNIKFD